MLVCGLIGLGGYLFRDRIFHGPQVSTGLVIAVPMAGQRATDDGPENARVDSIEAPAVQFQASGWVEASPAGIHVTAMINGVVRTVEVREGDEVQAGTLLATLDDSDTRLALDMAKADYERTVAEVGVAAAEIESAENQWKARMAAVDSALASVEETRDLSARFERLPDGAMPAVERVAARLALARAEAALVEQRARVTEAQAEIKRRQGGKEVAETNRRKVAVAVAVAELAQARTRITAPVAGRVQSLLAAPGQRMRVDGDNPDSAAIARLYQPSALQIRVDVPLADAGDLAAGQRVRVMSNLLPDVRLDGLVLFIGGQADRQRNTLPVTVGITKPDPKLRPETLCRVEFLAAQRAESPGGAPSSQAGQAIVIFVPQAAVQAEANGRARAWVVNPESMRVSMRDIVPGQARRDDHREVIDGLRPGERVILNPGDRLANGQRVHAEDVAR